jgi:hypothetical protein
MATRSEVEVERRETLEPAIQPRPPRLVGLASAFLLHAGVAFLFVSGSPRRPAPEAIEVTVLAEAVPAPTGPRIQQSRQTRPRPERSSRGLRRAQDRRSPDRRPRRSLSLHRRLRKPRPRPAHAYPYAGSDRTPATAGTHTHSHA